MKRRLRPLLIEWNARYAIICANDFIGGVDALRRGSGGVAVNVRAALHRRRSPQRGQASEIGLCQKPFGASSIWCSRLGVVKADHEHRS